MIKSKIAVAVVAALTIGYGSAYAQSTPADQADTSQQSSDQAAAKAKAKKLQAVTVTGSLIPQSQIETAQPITTITAQDIKAKGFTTVAEALQATSFAVGSVQGQQNTNSFTTGAETLSLFGLPVGFTKYLIDGRPMGNFPGLYNGSDTFNSISGIPADLVDHIDILPGGQSSLYGSDAIAGVINIVLKKHVDAPSLDVRYGWYKNGGGADRRVSFADSFNVGKFNSLFGFQFESKQPIYTGDRSLTKQYYTEGTSPAVASRDYLVLNAGGADPAGYLFLDPNNCSTVSAGFDGTTAKQTRPGRGSYCGSFHSPAYGTVSNGSKTANFYTHDTFDVSDNLQLYGDLLYNYAETQYTNGSSTSFWSSQLYAAKAGGGYFFDPRMGDLLLLQHAFSPEEAGGSFPKSTQTENSYMLTLGGKGTFGSSNWDYDLGFTHSDDHLINRDFQRFTAPLEAYYESHVLGPQMGSYYGYPVFQPNYAALYNPVSKTDFASFTGFTDNRSKTWDNLVRGQITNGSLFAAPGGDAGIAVVVEGGNEGWNSSPDPRLLSTITDVYGNTDPEVWGNSAVPGAGHRSRMAATTEFRVPLLQQLTLDVSGRYDKYNVDPEDFSHKTYNIGLEYRPFDTLLLRGRYGTAFKAPTLSDEFQGKSGYFNTTPDYLNCGRLGFGPNNVNSCPTPYDSEQYNGLTYGNPALKPITAKVWSYGFVWSPIARMSFTVDYLHFDINNEVAQLSGTQLSNTEYLCDTGALDPKSGTCAQAFSLITRGPGKTVVVNGVPTQLLGQITNISTPKLNVANEQVNALTAAFNYAYDFGRFGNMGFNLSYSDELKHTYQDFVTDPKLDELRHPNFSTDFKTKVNAALTWGKGDWSTTVYVNRYGRTPNYLAQLNDNYTAKGTGKLGAWILYNASVTYTPVKNLGLSFLVNNVFNKMPPQDHSYPGTTSSPYNALDYNVYGRAMFLEADYKFGNE